MTKILVVYDDTGYVLYQETGKDVRVPVGLQHIIADLPNGKRLKVVGGIGVDVTEALHKLVFEDIPKDETQMTVAQIQEQLQFVTFGLLHLTQDVNQLKLTNNNSSDIINQLANLLSTIKAGA